MLGLALLVAAVGMTVSLLLAVPEVHAASGAWRIPAAVAVCTFAGLSWTNVFAPGVSVLAGVSATSSAYLLVVLRRHATRATLARSWGSLRSLLPVVVLAAVHLLGPFSKNFVIYQVYQSQRFWFWFVYARTLTDCHRTSWQHFSLLLAWRWCMRRPTTRAPDCFRRPHCCSSLLESA